MKKSKAQSKVSVPRNQVPLFILAVLFDHGRERGLTRREIESYLEDEHGLSVDRTAVTRNLKQLEQLCDAGAISMFRIDKKGEGNSTWKWRLELESEFDSSEIRFLLDAVIAFPSMPEWQRDDLVLALRRLGGESTTLPGTTRSMDSFFPNKQLFNTISVLDEAIRENRSVSFRLNGYGPDKKLHHDDKWHNVRPFQLLMQNGRYYLLLRYLDSSGEWAEKNYHFRVDLITDIELGEPVDKRKKTLWPKELICNGFNAADYRAKHPILWSDDLETIRFRIMAEHCGWAVDQFGGTVTFSPSAKKDFVEATVRTSPEAVKRWVLTLPVQKIEVLEPESLRESIRKAAQELLEQYRDDE